MAMQDGFGGAGGSGLGPKLGGFFAGVALCLLLGLFAGVAFSGGGLGDPRSTPPQVYTNF